MYLTTKVSFSNVLNVFAVKFLAYFLNTMVSPLSLNQEHNACLSDQLEKNKFRCDWLNKEIKIAEDLTKVITGETIKKVDVSRKIICEIYNILIIMAAKNLLQYQNILNRKNMWMKYVVSYKILQCQVIFFLNLLLHQIKATVLHFHKC